MAGKQAAHPAATEHLMEYWTTGEGGQKIRWGVPGDFKRAKTLIQAAIARAGHKPLPEHEINGLAANLHHRATGAWPGHAPGEQVAHHKH
jgi:hypothetical protein